MMILFLCSAFFGVLFLLGSLIFGGDHDVGHDLDHDVGHDLDHDTDMQKHFNVAKLFSLRSITAFMATFGATGAICLYYEVEKTMSVIIAVISGIIMAIIVIKIMELVFKQQSNSLIRTSSFVGEKATVTTPIPQNGPGEVVVNMNGSSTYLMAYSDDGNPIGLNEIVTITSVTNAQVTVNLEFVKLKKEN